MRDDPRRESTRGSQGDGKDLTKTSIESGDRDAVLRIGAWTPQGRWRMNQGSQTAGGPVEVGVRATVERAAIVSIQWTGAKRPEGLTQPYARPHHQTTISKSEVV